MHQSSTAIKQRKPPQPQESAGLYIKRNTDTVITSHIWYCPMDHRTGSHAEMHETLSQIYTFYRKQRVVLSTFRNCII